MLRALGRASASVAIAAVAVYAPLGFGCGGDRPDVAPAVFAFGDAGVIGQIPGDTVPRDASPPTIPRVVPGTLLAPGRAFLIGATDDGYLAYFRPASSAPSMVDLCVLDTRTAKTERLAVMSELDAALVRGKAILGWSDRGEPLGFGTMNVWTAATGLATAPSTGRGSWPGVFATNADATRIAFTNAVPASTSCCTNITVSLPTFAAAAVVVPEVSLGTSDAPCVPSMRFAGTRLYFSVGDQGLYAMDLP
jgi:hypothetical protein